MKQQTLQVDVNSKVVIESIPGDLRVAGWDRAEIMARTNGDDLEVNSDENTHTITCDDDLILYLPRQINLSIGEVDGDVGLQAMMGEIKLDNTSGNLTINSSKQVVLEKIDGDATFRNTGGVELGDIQGDFNLIKSSGDCVAVSIQGDASLSDVEGNVKLDSVAGDLFLRNIKGSIEATTSGDAAINLVPVEDTEYRVNANGDLLLHLPADANAELHLATLSSDDESIQVDMPGVKLEEGSPSQKVTLGEGSAKLFLTAGEELIVTSKSDRWSSAADFGVGMSDFTGIPPIPPIPSIPFMSDDLSERINRKVQKAMEKAQSRTEGISRRTEAKMEAAMRRAEARVRAAGVRARRGKASGRVVVGGTEVFNFSSSKKPATPRVSDDERLTILKMLQDKKISAEDAENLFAALEGKGE